MIDKTMNTVPKYSAPISKVVSISIKAQILADSLYGSVSANEYNRGSESYVGFGDDEDD